MSLWLLADHAPPAGVDTEDVENRTKATKARTQGTATRGPEGKGGSSAANRLSRSTNNSSRRQSSFSLIASGPPLQLLSWPSDRSVQPIPKARRKTARCCSASDHSAAVIAATKGE